MAKVENVQKVIALLQKRQMEWAGDSAKRAKGVEEGQISVIVGYTAGYALYVHEDLEANHKVGQAKYLEQPARELSEEFPEIVSKAMQKGQGFATGLLMAGLRLQRESQKLVPVEYGLLKNSAFTVLE